MTAQVIHGDCLEVMPTLPDQSIDMILCDLPYGTTACKWDTVIPFDALWEQYERLIKPNGAIVLTASQPFTSALVMSKPAWFRHEWVWHKSNGGGFLNANRAPLKRHESVLVFSKKSPDYFPIKTPGKPYTCQSSSAGVTTFDQSVAGWVTENEGSRYPTTVMYIPNQTGLHPTQKPVALFEYLIRTYTREGDTVLDNCAGSFTSAIACLNTGRSFICIEREERYVEVGRRRIAEWNEKTAASLFDSIPEPLPQPSLFSEAHASYDMTGNSK